MEITTKDELNDLRGRVLRREEVSLEHLRAAVRFLREGRVNAKPAAKKTTKAAANIDDLLGLGE